MTKVSEHRKSLQLLFELQGREICISSNKQSIKGEIGRARRYCSDYFQSLNTSQKYVGEVVGYYQLRNLLIIRSSSEKNSGKSWGREVTAQREVECNAFHYYPVME